MLARIILVTVLAFALLGCAAHRQDQDVEREIEELRAAQETMAAQLAGLDERSARSEARIAAEVEALREQVAELAGLLRKALEGFTAEAKGDAERIGRQARESALKNLEELLKASTKLLERLNRELEGSLAEP